MRTMPVKQTIDEPMVETIEDRPGMSLKNLVHIVYKRKWFVLFVFIFSAAIASAVIVRFAEKPLYVATSQILVSPSREQLVNPSGQIGGEVPPWLGFNAVEQTAWVREILTGRFLAERVVKAIGPSVLYPRPSVQRRGALDIIWNLVPIDGGPAKEVIDDRVAQEKAVSAFLMNVSAEPAGRSSIINLSFKHENPELVARVVNLLGEMYLERHLGVQKNPKSDSFFQEQFVMLKQRLAEAEENILGFKQRHGITSSIKQEQELALQQQTDLRKELTETRSKQAEVQSRDTELRRQLTHTSRNPATISQLRDKLTSLEIQESELALRFTNQNPTLRGVRDEIRKLREKLNTMDSASLYGTTAGQDSLFAKLQGDLLSNEAEGRALRAREANQTAKIAELQARLDTLERIQPEFSHLEKQLQMDESNHRLYLTKFEESRISDAMDAEKIAGVRVIEQAHTPMTPLKSKRNLKILLGVLFSGVGALGLAFVLHFLRGSLDTVEDVERALELPVLASIPRLQVK
jgi:polysaccharide biosynthesis protein PslE